MSLKTPVGAIFDSLKGSWRLKRSLNSALPGYPSGIFEGTAIFSTRANSASEFLYAEQGELKTENGFSLKGNRKYVYRYDADADRISAWFVTEDSKLNAGKEKVDYLFHDLEVKQTETGWVAEGEHLCDKDMYWAFYDFSSPSIVERGQEMDVFGVRYKVKGPNKDYTSDTAYQRTFDTDTHAS